MSSLEQKKVIVAGLGLSGQAACDLLLKCGALVYAVDDHSTPALMNVAENLASRGVRVRLSASTLPAENFDLAVVSPGLPPSSPVMKAIKAAGIPTIGELELGYQNALCLNVAISGTNGKTTTTELVERMLTRCDRKTIAAGNIGTPICSVIEEARSLDFLTLEVSSFQLETIRYFRPSVAVLLNITPDHLDRYPSMKEYIEAKAMLFKNQQDFDWSIIQYEALQLLQKHQLRIPGKIITFSATDSRADIIYERGLLISKIEGWSGPLLDLETTLLAGPHNAENIMATLAVGRVLRLPLERTLEAVRTYKPARHRCEVVAEVDGVLYVNDSKATNVDATVRALMTMRGHSENPANVLLIAGGKYKGFEYHDAGPWISKRVKAAFLIGETAEKIRAAWGLFTPCAVLDSLLEAVTEARKNALPGDVVLLSPACSSFDQFQNYQHRGEVFCDAVRRLRESTNGGVRKNTPKGREQNPVTRE